MLDPAGWAPAAFDGQQPLLMVLIDTEEEFDWNRPVDRASTGVANIKAQQRAHRIFERYGITPIYVIDYPVATKPDGYRPLLELHQDGACDIGAHLHPWVNPPFDEPVNNRNSFPGNLDPALERRKLEVLSGEIGAQFGAAPHVYKAGRYGVGPATTDTLAALGYRIDASVVPETDFSGGDGPDFSPCGARPYWFGPNHALLELPMTVHFVGFLKGAGNALYRPIASELGLKLKISNTFATLRLMERIRLTPEGTDAPALERLTRTMLAAGHRVFSFTYHSSSLLPGCAPYVQSDADLADFLDRFDRFFDFFMGTLGGRAARADELYALARRPDTAPQAA